MKRAMPLKPLIAGAALLVAGGTGYATLYAAPKAKLTRELASHRQAVQSYEAALKRRLEITSGLRSFADTTLGASKDEVESRFRTGLYSVATACGLTGIEVNTREITKETNPLASAKLSSAFAPLKKELKSRVDFYSIPGEITATGTLEQVLRTTAMIRQQSWVHRIQSFSIKPADKENARFSLRLGVTTVLLPPELAPKERGEPVVLALAEGSDAQWQKVVRKNVFREPPAPKPAPAVAEKPAQPAPPPPPPEVPQRPAFEEWKLTGVVQSRLGIEAFLVHTKSGQRLSLPTGAAIADAKFVSGSGERAVFEIAGQQFEITNGQTLEHRRPLTR
jgi:hypothetical protein